MSDRDAPDPMDKAYAEAEALLADEAARAARRARVLAAVAAEPAAESGAVAPAAPVAARRSSAWGRGGWLAAASVAGLGLFLAMRVYAPTVTPPQVIPLQTAPAAQVPAAAAPASLPTIPAAPVPKLSPSPARRSRAAPASPEPPPPAAPAPATAAAEARNDNSTISEMVVTGQRIPSPNLAAPAPPQPAAAARSSNTVEEMVVVTGARRASAAALAKLKPADRAARLREAAADGRIAEVTTLLAQHTPVDGADDEGETALMKAVQADQPAAVALLRAHGASLDLKNHAGASVRDMAASAGDAALDRALGLSR